MSARLTLPLSFLGSIALAIAVLALVLGRADVPTATFLVYTVDERTPPQGSLVEAPGGRPVVLRFELVESDVVAQVAERRPAGVLLDAGTFAELPREVVAGWRAGGLVLVAFDVDAAQFALELDAWATVVPAAGEPNQFILVGGADMGDVTGDLASLDRDSSFVGAAYRPPTSGGDAEQVELGRLGWFQNDEPGFMKWLAEAALDSVEDYGRSLD